MNNESVLAKVAYSLAPGSMVYLSAEDSFFLKTDEKKNIWRKIDMVCWINFLGKKAKW